MILTGKSGSWCKHNKCNNFNLLLVFLPIILSACSTSNAPPPPLAAPRGELRTDASEIDAPAALRMAQRFENAGDLRSALNMYRRAIQVDAENISALLGVARIYGQAGAREESTRYYKRILQLEPKNSHAATAVAEEKIFKGEAREAISFINQFIITSRGTAALFNLLGIAHDLEGDHGDAQLAYAEGLNIEPEDTAITSNLALSFAVREDYPTAIALLERVLGDSANSDEEDRAVARQNLALVYALSGQLAAAEDIARTALSEQEVEINRAFYARLAGLTSTEKAHAVFLGSLPSEPEESVKAQEPEVEQTLVVQLASPPATEEGKDAAAAAIIRGQGITTIPAQTAGDDVATATIEDIPPGQADFAATAVAPDEYPPYWVQLGSYRSPQRAGIGWDTLSTQFPDLLDGYLGYLQTYDSGERGQFFRLMVQASETRSAANLVCQTFKISGMDCLVIKTGGNIGLLQD